MDLLSPVSALRMVGPQYAKKLAKLNIHTIRDLLLHIPHRYEDYSLISPINRLQAGETVTIKGEIISANNVFSKNGKKIQKVLVADNTGHIELTWFNQLYITTSLKPGTKVSLSGKVGFFGPKLTLISPEYEILHSSFSIQNLIHTGRLVPIYPETAGVSSKWLRSRIFPLINLIPSEDPLPTNILQQYALLNWPTAVKTIHFPSTISQTLQATRRLAFDELLQLHLVGLIRKNKWQQQKLTHQFAIDQEKILEFKANLPFNLTPAQTQAIKQILSDLSSTIPANRLIIGDVGSGKTVVAATAIYQAFLNGFQSLLMAPTQILAHQHEQTLRSLLKPLGVKIGLVTSSSKSLITNHQSLITDLVIGTHALLHHPELLKNVGLVVIDEQHRFGVSQRSALVQPRATGHALPAVPHTLSLTATPIPRTAALTLYGNVDVSYINELPLGRIPVKTWVVPPHKRSAAYQWITKEIATHKTQAFIVCPLIEESESESLAQVKAATVEYQQLKTHIFPHLKLALLHGKVKTKDKQTIIGDFTASKTDILVATPVIEVGIDIPNASIIVIEAAERFGLAQLHQLRGRVGRRNQQAYCLLFSESTKPQVVSRLKTMEQENSGSKLAEIDLQLRGPGELYGTRQHGFLGLKIATLSDANLVQTTRTVAETILKQDPELANLPLLRQHIDGLLNTPIEPN